MTYIPDPTDPTQPTASQPAQSAAAEFRALKAYLQSVLADIGIGGLNFYRKNKLHNADFKVDQRNEFLSTTSSPFPFGYVADRWNCLISNSTTTGISSQVAANTLGGASNKMASITVTGSGSVTSISQRWFRQGIEGKDIADLFFGTANAKPISLSFLISSQVAGTHCVAIQNGAGTRSYVATFNIALANTPYYITINDIPGDQSGVWPVDSTLGMQFIFDLGSGSNYETTAATWETGDFTRVSGAAIPLNTAGTYSVTCTQLEQAAAASAFDMQDYTHELLVCKRFFWKTYAPGVAVGAQTIGAGAGVPTTEIATQVIVTVVASNDGVRTQRMFDVEMRIVPTMSYFSPANVSGNLVNWYNFTESATGPAAALTSSSSLTKRGLYFQQNWLHSTYSWAAVDTVLLHAAANADFY